MSFGAWDIALIAVVTAQVALVAYLHRPLWKALVLTLPFPFTLASLALGRRVDATNVLGLLLLLGTVNVVRWLHYRMRVAIMPSIGIGVAANMLAAVGLAPLVPTGNAAFYVSAAAVAGVSGLIFFLTPMPDEPGHRTPLPVHVKVPGVAAMVTGLVLLKALLLGFMTTFPMVTTFALYEARHSLRTVCRQMAGFVLAFMPMVMICRLAHPAIGLSPALLLGWTVFLSIWIPRAIRSRVAHDGSRQPAPLAQADSSEHPAA